MKKESKSNFSLKDNRTLFIPSAHKHVKNETMTDQDALAFLSSHPKGINLFDKFPEDWEKQTADFSAASKAKKTASKEIPDAKAAVNTARSSEVDESSSDEETIEEDFAAEGKSNSKRKKK